jgi:hypothetical protein
MQVLGDNNPNLPAIEEEKLERSRRRFFQKQIERIIPAKHFHNISTSDVAIYLRLNADSDQIPNLQPYMRKLIEEASNRVYKYRYAPHMLSFSDNERIMLHRLYEVIK